MAAESETAAAETTKITRAEHPPGQSGSQESPPSYDSIYGRLKSVRREASGPKDAISKSCEILCASVVGTILLAPVLAVPIAMIVVGAIHLHDCTIERLIPIYLVVGGCFGALQTLLTFSLRVKNHRETKEGDCERQEERAQEGSGRKKFKDSNSRPHPGSGLISCFLFAWFIAGSVWVYSNHKLVNTSDVVSPYYCHGSVYWFAFVLITCGYVCMALSCCCFAVCGIIMCAFGSNDG